MRGWFRRRQLDAETRILTALAEPWGNPQTIIWSYGLDLMRRTGMRPGRFYPALGRLERAGMVEARWDEKEPNPKRRRRMYRPARHDSP